jgi:hypothetical protein
MTDWREAGQKADAHRVRDLYRRNFASDVKDIARHRAAEVLLAAGGETVLDLWGGGVSAQKFTAEGFRVISVDDGSMDLSDRGQTISASRKKRALEQTAAEDGYEARFGEAAKFAHEANVAFLDFCGPWSRGVRQTIEACRHMQAVVVTLVTDHDINTKATTQEERLVCYKELLKLAFAGSNTQAIRRQPCRLLYRYKTSRGHPVLVFLLARGRLPIKHLSGRDRRADIEYRTREDARNKERMRNMRLNDPEQYAKRMAYIKRWRAAKRADPEYLALDAIKRRHYEHRKGSTPRKSCPLCEQQGRLGPASPA